jgi:hypothetical protein
MAYDREAVKTRGLKAITNFDMSSYLDLLAPEDQAKWEELQVGVVHSGRDGGPSGAGLAVASEKSSRCGAGTGRSCCLLVCIWALLLGPWQWLQEAA